jgi:DNA-damage-inducible protein J
MEVTIMATIQVRVDDQTKAAVDSLFTGLGLDTSTAVRMFLMASLNNDGIPFAVRHDYYRKPNADLLEAIEDTRLRRNLIGPFATAEEAVRSMLED